eukprot:COSAG02_NODE_51632_length_313_cov_0.542056_1_plen_35_part_01
MFPLASRHRTRCRKHSGTNLLHRMLAAEALAAELW